MPIYKLEPIEGTEGHNDWRAFTFRRRLSGYRPATPVMLV